MFIGPCIIAIVDEWKTNLMSLALLFHFLCAQHVSDINIAIIRSLRLCCWITTSVVLFSVRCVLEIWCGWCWVVLVLQASACKTSTTQHTKRNKIASDIKLVFHSSTIAMMHGPINIRFPLHVSACTGTILSHAKIGTCTGKYNRNLRGRLTFAVAITIRYHTMYIM